MAFFLLLKSLKLISRKNLGDRKILKFPHRDFPNVSMWIGLGEHD